MHSSLIVVDGYVPAAGHTPDNLRDEVWSYALDQRAFGPRRLLVVFADADGTLRGLAYTDRTDPPELGLEACLAYMGEGAAAAIAYCDQAVTDGPPPPEFTDLFARAWSLSRQYGVHLVDWIACDDDLFRSNRVPPFEYNPGGQRDGPDWWDVPLT